ncbi:hypothetical protein NUW58_g2135 [Xylaria curta]|uniref:Uncharacterized protein n=1 Tax=Xylaria curta TaxID=42375 RepID=A0ACC1PGZ2_9PEZI|nr:hypothetical protein NUW58_g2135 [Xylaria curta]
MAKRYSSLDLDTWRLQLSQTIEKLGQELNKFEAAHKDRELEGDSTDGNGDDNRDDAVHADDESGVAYDDDSSSETKGFFCPEVECRGRKADATLKKYVRHYDTHVKCQVPCAVCPTISYHVAALKRHCSKCLELKKKRNMPEYSKELTEMRAARENESRRAFAKARKALASNKRSHGPDADDSRSRKKARLDKRMDVSTCRAADRNISSSGSTLGIDIEHNGYSIAEATNRCARAQNTTSPGSAPGGIDTTNRSIASPVVTRLTGNNTTTISEALDFASSTADESATCHIESQYSIAQDIAPLMETLSIVRMMDNSSMYANSQVSATQHPIMATRASSFLSHTMDGLYVYADGQYPTAQDTATAINAPRVYFPNDQYSIRPDVVTATRASSFVSHSMDGSAMYINDQYPIARNTAMLQDPPS